jgi:hypothetical protein
MDLGPDSIRLTGRRALVTGAARGIGRATAVALARFGADVAVCDRLGDELEHGSSRSRCSAPARSPLHLADLGADVIKVEPPQGDYIRQMTWPIIEGVSLLHLHTHRGKRASPSTCDRRGPGPSSRTSCRRRRRRRGHAPRCPRQARPRLRGPAEDQPEDRLLHHLRLRHDRPVREPAEPRHRLRHLGRARPPRLRRGRLLPHPARAPVDRHQRRPDVRRLRPARRHHAARETGEGC